MVVAQADVLVTEEREEEMVSDIKQAATIIHWPVVAAAVAAASVAKPTTSVPVVPAVAAVAAAPVVALERTIFNYTRQDLSAAMEVIVQMAARQEKVPTAI